MGADFWTIASAVGSVGSAVGTIGAAILAGRLAWLSAYGAKPWISELILGRRALNPEKTEFAKELGLSITNRQKVPVTVYRIVVCVPGDVFTGKPYSGTFIINDSKPEELRMQACEFSGDTVRFLFKEEIRPGQTGRIHFLAPLSGAGDAMQNARFMAYMQRDEPYLSSFWITRIVDVRKLNSRFRKRPPWSLRWFVNQHQDRLMPPTNFP
ncbi:hypothetical protein [Aureimonas sp. D3]|uniref:hypothetical protein n=1 Tax=Aureimonas sp. D3 TaxID=1638164 RepID=UPI00078093DA|nr:hypothetical protein [Aureimonas sp. D3]